MNSLQVTRYSPRHHILKNLIKYYWLIESESPVEINHKLLPVNNIDFILNFSSPINYLKNGENEIVSKKFHFNGIRNEHCLINQSGLLRVFGISFMSTGLFPILKMPLSEFTNKTTEIDVIIKNFTEIIMNKINIGNSILYDSDISNLIEVIEDTFLNIIDTSLIPKKEIYEVFQIFNDNINEININTLCNDYGINKRTLERLFNKYIGISPKGFHRINRIQKIVNHLKNEDNSFTLVAHNNNYYDQTHFIKDFKSFTGCTPKEFLNKDNFIKQIIKSY